ncbi:MAG: heavy-metal-associated domain-containing protein [Actinomycetota bacterium]|jgi:copper chaperone CopZ|nr:heavy-metal-associated domain-containing protein [Actinomycetota bacterium]
MAEKIYQVEGMTCGHCVNAVTEEVEKVDGVNEVSVSLDEKTLRVMGEGYSDADIVAAVEEAGYEVVVA